MTTQRRSRVPDGLSIEPSHFQFLDSIDKRQQRVADIDQVSASPSNAELAAALNAIIQAHKTR